MASTNINMEAVDGTPVCVSWSENKETILVDIGGKAVYLPRDEFDHMVSEYTNLPPSRSRYEPLSPRDRN